MCGTQPVSHNHRPIAAFVRTLQYRWLIGTVQGAVATWRLVGNNFRGRQVATAPCTVPFSEFASTIRTPLTPGARLSSDQRLPPVARESNKPAAPRLSGSRLSPDT